VARVRRQEFELPREALALVEQVRALEARAEAVRSTLAGELQGIREAASEERREVAKDHVELEHDREALEALLASRVRGFDFIADAWADYEHAKAMRLGTALQYKSHPAGSAAKEIRAKGKEMATLRRELKRAEWVLRLYEWHFPWLTELRDFEEEQSFVAGEDADVETDDGFPADPAQHWLSEEEFHALPEVERNQRALDRYLRSRKTPWQLGRDYERYIGYLREVAGARVKYQGIFAGLEDLGRDLLAERDGVIEVIQCKRWARHKTHP
jgi:hypothetical protein